MSIQNFGTLVSEGSSNIGPHDRISFAMEELWRIFSTLKAYIYRPAPVFINFIQVNGAHLFRF